MSQGIKPVQTDAFVWYYTTWIKSSSGWTRKLELQMNTFQDALWAGMKGTPYITPPKISSRQGVSKTQQTFPWAKAEI